MYIRDDAIPTILAAELLLIDAGAPLSAAQVRLNDGLVDKSLVMANFSLFAEFESCNVYH